MSIKCCVIGDPTNKPKFSSHVIVSNLNKALQELDLFGDDVVCKWDSLCQSHGDKVDVYISSYELSFPDSIIERTENKPLLGVGSDNYQFILNGGKSITLSDWFSLGVDSTIWRSINKNKDLDRFSVFVYTESLVRGGIESCIESFVLAFKKDRNCVLKIKDRNGDRTFNEYIKNRAKYYDINIEYINDNWDEDQVKEYLRGIDIHLYLNKISTFALPPLELLSCSIPSIILNYGGPKDYCIDNYNCLTIKYELEPIRNSIYDLIDIGCRNFFILNGYKITPTWAIPDINDVAKKLLILKENTNNICFNLKKGARETAEKLDWKSSAKQLHSKLLNWF